MATMFKGCLFAAENKRKLVLEWISSSEPAEKHQDQQKLRTKNTCGWVLEDDQYKIWTSKSPAQRVLWCRGFPGSGKSVVFSHIVDTLMYVQDHAVRDIGLAYFYCDYRDRETLTLEFLFGSLAKQLVRLSHPKTLSKEISELYDSLYERRGLKPSLNTFEEIFKLMHSRYEEIFILIDGIDELDAPSGLLAYLKRFDLESKAHFLITSRSHLQEQQIRQHLATPMTINIVAHSQDVRAFLHSEIENVMTQKRNFIDKDLALKIVNSVVESSKGLFLLPSLNIKIILQARSKNKCLDTLQNLPQTFGDAYKETIARIKADDNYSTVKKILQWVRWAARTLTIDELLRAVATATEPDAKDLDDDDIDDPDHFLGYCMGLVNVGSNGRDVQLVHESLQSYLDQEPEFFERVQEELSQVCLRYIMLESNLKVTTQTDLDDRLPLYRKKIAFLNAVSVMVGAFSEEIIQQSRRALMEVFGRTTSSFIEYASFGWGYHGRLIKELDDKTAASIFQYLNMDRSIGCCLSFFMLSEAMGIPFAPFADSDRTKGFRHQSPGTFEILNGRFRQSITNGHVLAYFGFQKALLRCLDASPSLINIQDSRGWTPLMYAVGNIDCAHLLIGLNADKSLCNNKNESVIHICASNSDLELAKILKITDRDLQQRDGAGKTPLHRAMWSQSPKRTEMVSFLMEKGVPLVEDHDGKQEWFAICWAIAQYTPPRHGLYCFAAPQFVRKEDIKQRWFAREAPLESWPVVDLAGGKLPLMKMYIKKRIVIQVNLTEPKSVRLKYEFFFIDVGSGQLDKGNKMCKLVDKQHKLFPSYLPKREKVDPEDDPLLETIEKLANQTIKKFQSTLKEYGAIEQHHVFEKFGMKTDKLPSDKSSFGPDLIPQGHNVNRPEYDEVLKLIQKDVIFPEFDKAIHDTIIFLRNTYS
ncbi:hypothetical protein ACLMJK_009299 [Lecanora helva]